MKKRKHSNTSTREKKANSGASNALARHKSAADKLVLYGLHAVKEALNNPRRRCIGLKASKNALRELEKEIQNQRHASLSCQETPPDKLNQMFKPGTVHQGVALTVAPLPEIGLAELTASGKTIIVLDQVTDPRNIGSIMRSAAVFGAAGLVVTRRNAPAPAGALAKTASGALEHVPLVTVANLSRSLKELADSGYVTLGLDEQGEELMAETDTSRPVALVMGAEGKGLRRLTKESCTRLVRLPNAVTRDGADFACLNVATATAVSLYELAR